jgi:hypothetical protein
MVGAIFIGTTLGLILVVLLVLAYFARDLFRRRS